MSTPTLVQVRLETTPTLRAIERVAALRARGAGSGFEGERDVAAREAERLCLEWRLGSAWLRAYAPTGALPGEDDGMVTSSGMPWWRAQLAVVAAIYYGFSGKRPWVAGRTDHAVRLLGTRSAVDGARALYASLAVGCAAAARRARRGERDEFLLGCALGAQHELQMAAGERQRAQDIADRRALIVRPPEQAPRVDLRRSAASQDSALQRGIAAARGLGDRALGRRPAPTVNFYGFSGLIGHGGL